MDDFQSILENGISFKGSSGPKKEEDKVKTKAKKKKYITGAHGVRVRRLNIVNSELIAIHANDERCVFSTLLPIKGNLFFVKSLSRF